MPLFFFSGHYQALGRVIHVRYLKERLETQKRFNFNAVRKTIKLVQQLDILADTLYIEVNIPVSVIEIKNYLQILVLPHFSLVVLRTKAPTGYLVVVLWSSCSKNVLLEGRPEKREVFQPRPPTAFQ